MITPYLIIFCFVILLVFLEQHIEAYKWYIYIFIGVILILMCTFKTIGADDDSQTYELIFEHYDDRMAVLSVEFSYRWLAEILNNVSNDVSSIFFVYALISIPLKFYALKENSEYVFLPLMIYLSHFFILHDMIEIRVSVAAAFLLLALKPLNVGDKKKAFLLLCCGTFFHYSMLVTFPLLFMGNATLSRKWKCLLGSVVPLGYIAYFMRFDILMELPIPYIGEKLEIYKEMKSFGGFEEIFIFKNPLLLLTIAVYYLLLFYYDTVYQYKSQLPICLKIMGLSLGSFFFFSSLPVLSGRLYELYGVVNILTFTYLYYIIKPSYAAKAIIAVMALVIMFMDIFVYELIKPV